MANIIDVVMRLTDNVTDPLRNIRRQMEETANINQRLGRNVSRLGDNISSIGQAMMPAATAVAAAGAVAGKTFMDFEATITGAAVKAGAKTEAEFNKMRDVAGKLGAEFPISASQAAEGMDRLAAGGFNVDETIGAMPSIIKAAVASGEDLAATSNVVTSALSIWNLKQGDIAANTEHVADVIQMAANVSKLGMNEFGLAMQYAGAPAAALGVRIEELGAAMAVMSNNGIEASTIGTSLRATMSRLASPPKAAAAAIEQLGLKIKDADGNFVGLENVMGQMRTAMEGLSDTEQVALAKAIAGEDAYSGLLSIIKTSPEAYAEVANSIRNSAGSSNEAYQTMQKTLKGSIDAMTGSIESFGIAMGTVLSPYIKEAAETVKYFANVLTDMGPEQQKMLVMAGAAVIGFTGLTMAVGKAISIGGALITTYGRIGRVMAGGHISNKLLEYSVRGVMSAYSGIGSVATQGLGALSSAGTAAGGVFDTVRRKAAELRGLTWADIGRNISNVFSGASTAASNRMQAIRAAVGNTMASVINNATRAAAAMSNFSARAAIGNVASRAASGVTALGRSFLTAARAGMAFALSPIGIAMIAIAGAAYLIYKNWDKVGPFFVSLWNRIKAAFSSAVGALQPQIDRMKAVFDALRVTVGAMVTAAFEKLKAAFASVSGTISAHQGAIDTLVSILTTVATIAGGVVVGAFVVLANVVTSAITTAIGIASAVIGGFIGVLTGIIEFVTGVFTGDWQMAWNGIKDIFGGVFDAIAGICSSVMGGIKDTVMGVIDSIKSLAGAATGTSVSVSTENVKHNAKGGIYGRGAFLTTFAEDSPEAAIPIDHSARALSLWQRTGEMLGVMPKMADVDLSAGFRNMIEAREGGPAASQTIINNQMVREGQQGKAPEKKQAGKQDFNISINMGGVTIQDAKADAKAFSKEIVQTIVYEIQKRAINMNVGAI